MQRYNVLNETDYYPRSKYAEDLNPTYPDRKVVINQRLAEVQAYSSTALSARSWIGAAACELDHPKMDEFGLFLEASRELERLSGEVRR